MKTKFRAMLVAMVLASLTLIPALAQESALELKLSRDWGYGGFAGDIQGRFTMKASGPESLVGVVFMIDDLPIAEDDTNPFETQFHTDSFEIGIHTLTAIGTLADGSEIESNVLTRDFVAGDAVLGQMSDMLIPLLGVIVLFALIGTFGPMLLGVKAKQRPVGQYGMAGGTVCKECGLPFSRNMLSPNLVVGKLSRCPHCNKIQISARASGEILQAAEERLRTDQDTEATLSEPSEEDRLREQLNASQYDD